MTITNLSIYIQMESNNRNPWNNLCSASLVSWDTMTTSPDSAITQLSTLIEVTFSFICSRNILSDLCSWIYVKFIVVHALIQYFLLQILL